MIDCYQCESFEVPAEHELSGMICAGDRIFLTVLRALAVVLPALDSSPELAWGVAVVAGTHWQVPGRRAFAAAFARVSPEGPDALPDAT